MHTHIVPAPTRTCICTCNLFLSPPTQAIVVALDIAHRLLAEGDTVIVKMNPVNEYAGPVLEKGFKVGGMTIQITHDDDKR